MLQGSTLAKADTVLGRAAQDVIRTGATHEDGKGTCDSYVQQLEELPTEAKPGSSALLKEIAERVPDLRRKTRQNTTQVLEKVTEKRALELGQLFLAETQETEVTTADVTNLLSVLQFFSKPEAKVMHSRLTTWSSNFAQWLAARDFLKLMESYIEDVTSQDYIDVVALEPGEWKKVLDKCPHPPPDAVMDALDDVLPEMLRRIFIQARCAAVRIESRV